MTSSTTIARILEEVWGIRFKPKTSVVVSINRPTGFIVAERRIKTEREGPWLVYWVKKTGISTKRLLKQIRTATGGTVSFMGLKDAQAVAYQYILVSNPERYPRLIQGEDFKAWLVGRRAKSPRLGSHLWNNFRITVNVIEGEVREFCEAFDNLIVPGFYGPQRFGIERPNTHIIGLLAGLPSPGLLFKEYFFTYPFQIEYREGYETSGIGSVQRETDPYAITRHVPYSIARDALQSYIWNRMLSAVYKEPGEPPLYEKRTRALCPGEGRAWIARLPSRKLLNSRGEWAGLARRVVRDEGLPWTLLPKDAPMRPVAVEACRASCRPAGNKAIVWVTLPRGIYATMAVRTAGYVSWIN